MSETGRWPVPARERAGTLTLVVNPTSGGGAARRLAPLVAGRLSAQLPHTALRTILTESMGHAHQVMIEAVARARADPNSGPHNLVVMGGDGMSHLGLNAAADSPVRLGIVPAGTGNDFCRGVGLPRRMDRAIEAIVSGRVADIDLAQATGPLHHPCGTGQAEARWLGSVLSSGYDARVNRRANALPIRFGAASYGYVALAELARFTPLRYRLVIDGRARELDAMLVAVGNAGWIGGGMRICPRAEVRDGMLDITIIHPVSRKILLAALASVYSGAFARLPFVELLRARTVTIDGESPADGQGLFAMADGEEFGDLPITVTCRPRALHLLGVS
ncbi:diacylglycerol/lipid kinase family protein [Acidipropionibacterium jensenii]|uniref:diacylglycerol/lipid kinase family protein n=1 Tax=Acidipropionibacterium jensenii TaxID=1749 RepID=UPI00214B282A